MARRKERGLRVAFLHPDLGLGGAERLVVDAAVELAERGHTVDVYTAFHDPKRCFQETVDGPFSVTVCGGWFPRQVFGRLLALCAYVRCVLVALHIAWASRGRGARYDVVIVDQVSAAIPVLRLLTSARILFYCHFPDLLLAAPRSALHRAYRAPLNALEESTTGQADEILVNSEFTRGVFAETFRRLHARGLRPAVLHPAAAIPTPEDISDAAASWREELPPEIAGFMAAAPTFLSINRFERKKGIGLAIQALARVGDGKAAGCRLLVAGGYDVRVSENVEHLEELRELAEAEGVSARVLFMTSFSDRQRALLLAACRAVLYTPQHEHFGIVPLEAMAAGRDVLACDSGGPKESVVHGETGFLCSPTPAAFADAMQRLLAEGAVSKLGGQARRHVVRSFSRTAFGDKLEAIVRGLAARGPR